MSIAEKLQTIAQNEQRVYNAGYEKGKAEGGDTETAYNQGLEDGKQAEYDKFWDLYQDYGNRNDYYYAFSEVYWNEETFKPKYNMFPTSTNGMFRNTGITDLALALEKQGVVLDTSNCTAFSNAFAYGKKLTHIGEINVTKATTINDCFRNNTELVIIDKIVFKEDGSQTLARAFEATPKLQNIVIEGVIGQTAEFHYSPLTVESMRSIITHLKNYSGTTNELKCTVSFSSGCWDALEASGTAPNGATWREYVEYELGWNT